MRVKIILFSAIILIGAVFGLRYWEKVSQKPRVWKAFAELVQDCTQAEYAMDAFWSIVKSGQTEQSGYLNVSHIDASILPEWKSIDVTLLQKASMIYEIGRDVPNKRMDAKISYSRAMIPTYEAEGYVDSQQIIIRIPKLHPAYLRAQTENIKSQYEHSLLYTVFSKQIPSPREEVSIRMFSEKERTTQGFADMVREFSENHAEEMKDFLGNIEVERQAETALMPVKNNYAELSVYQVTLPTEMIHLFYEEHMKDELQEAVPEVISKIISWKEESIPVTVYLNGKNQILRIDITVVPIVQGEEIKTLLTIYRKGEERLNDKLEVEISCLKGNEEWQILTWIENEWKQEARNIQLKIRMSKPYIMKVLDADIRYEPISGHMDLEYALKTPLLALDGEHRLEKLTREIQEPTDQVVDIFKLNFIGFLQFVKGLNY